MTKAARRFVDDWISENVEPTGREPEADTALAHDLALECLAAADKAGIDRAGIEMECGDLIAYMDEAIGRANAEEAKRLVGRVREDPSA